MTNRVNAERTADSTDDDTPSPVDKGAFGYQLKPDERTALAVFLGLLVIALLASAAVILRESGVVPAWPMDQSFAQSADLRIGKQNGSWVFHYPNLQNTGGITSVLIAGLYKLIVPTTNENLNWHIRIFSMSGYLISGAWLILSVLRQASVRLMALVLLIVSGYQFVQPSSELFAATLLCLFVVCAIEKSSVWLASLLLVGYGYCKVELILSGLVLAGFWFWTERQDPKRRLLIPISFATWFGALLIPSVYINGWQTLSGSRSWEAFKVKYTSLFHPHQINPPGSDPWDYSHQTIDQIFPATDHKIINVILKYPRKYLDYLVLALLQSVINIVCGIKFLVIPAILCFSAPRASNPRLRFVTGALLIAVLFGLLPAAFMGFIHIRYVMRYFPLFIVVVLGLCLETKQERSWVQPLVWVAAIATLVLQVIVLPQVIQQSHHL